MSISDQGDPDREHDLRSGPRPPEAATPTGQPGILAPLPRRAFLKLPVLDNAPPQLRTVAFQASRATVLRRLFVWLGIFLRFGAAIIWDTLRRTSTPAQRAVRLRKIFEQTGGKLARGSEHNAPVVAAASLNAAGNPP